MKEFKEYESILRQLLFLVIVILLGLILSKVSYFLLSGVDIIKEEYHSLVTTIISTLIAIVLYEIARKKGLL